MSGVNYRGRARLRDRQATERLSALLNGVGEGSSAGPERTVTESTAPAEEDSTRAQHRQPVRVRSRFSRPALIVLVAVLLVVCALAVISLVRGSGGPESDVVATVHTGESARPSPEADSDAGSRDEAGAGPVPGSGSGTAGPSPSGDPAATLTVHVVGEVRKPAVVEVPPGARVIDAVKAAGGLTDAAVTARVNLAQPVTDGQQVLIPNRDTAADLGAGSAGAPSAEQGDTAGPGPTAGEPVERGAPGTSAGDSINLNTADTAQLEELPRVGPVLAQRIVDFRTEHGPFVAAEQLDDVSGIGPVMLEALLPLVTV